MNMSIIKSNQIQPNLNSFIAEEVLAVAQVNVAEHEKLAQAKQFLDRHAGTRAFQWTPPLEEVGLYRCEQYKPVPLGGGNYSLSATFIQAFKP